MVLVYLFEVWIFVLGWVLVKDCWWDLARVGFGFWVIWVLVWVMAV